jgi:malonyl CoA-acyl carrier protein transacylase
MLACIFPGQGSQKRGMGQGLFDEIPQFRTAEAAANQLLGYSVRQQCLEDPGGRLKETQYTQPCLYVVNALHYWKALTEGRRPDFLAGHSLGEYNALLAAGAFDFLTGLRIVQKRGELMSRATNGGMAAVVGLGVSRIAALLKERGLGALDIANYNAPSQTALSGPVEDIKRAAPVFEQAGARLYMPLAVSAAFHSRYMADAARSFADFLSTFRFAPLSLPVMSNVTGQLYPRDHADGAVKSLLARQISESVQWTRCVRNLIAQGATEFREIGPGNVLTRLVQQIQQEKDA